jgi:chromosome segregation ATPase
MPRDEDPDHIPSITATREDAPSAGRGRAKGAAGGKPTERRAAGAPGEAASTGFLSRVFLAIALVVAAVACAWAWQLEENLKLTGFEMERQEKRIAELENLLSDTDETVNRSSAAMNAKINLLDSEVRKLWDARKATKSDVADNAGAISRHADRLSALAEADTAQGSKLQSLSNSVAKLNSVAGDLERLMSSARSNQSELERLADTVNRINLEYAKMGKRVESNEGWIESVNAFRRQVTASITQLEASMRALQNPAAAVPPGQ